MTHMFSGEIGSTVMAKKIVRVWVDEMDCASHYACKIVPEVFADSGHWYPLVPPDAAQHFDSQRDRIIEAVMACPTACIHLEFEDGRVVTSSDYDSAQGMRQWLEY